MKRILFRIENLLLLVPLLLLLVQQLFFSVNTIDIHLHDTMFVVSTGYLLWILFLLMLFYYSLHFLLRIRNSKGSFGCNFHAGATAVTLVLIFVFPFLSQPFDAITDYKEAEKVISSNSLLNYIAICVFLIFIILQGFFIFYFLFRITRKRLVSQKD
ncbi:MAG: hypothetical protein ABIR18_06225 [Chitinophagaceae bacterium]